MVILRRLVFDRQVLAFALLFAICHKYQKWISLLLVVRRGTNSIHRSLDLVWTLCFGEERKVGLHRTLPVYAEDRTLGYGKYAPVLAFESSVGKCEQCLQK